MENVHILIVDDEPSIRRVMDASLRAEGYDVSLESNGEEALCVAEESVPDLIILDIRMPTMDGFEVCRRIREWSQMPIIMLTALAEEEDKVKCFNLSLSQKWKLRIGGADRSQRVR